MNTRERLELAAKAMSLSVKEDASGLLYTGSGETWFGDEWNPAEDQGDSDRMACDLEISLVFIKNSVRAEINRHNGEYLEESVRKWLDHDGTSEDRRRAVREARMAVAVEIGRVMK